MSTIIEANCETAEVIERDMLPEEEEAMATLQEAAQANAAREEIARQADAELAAAVATHPDPIVKALAARLGLASP